jgi:hypothetical protein
VIFMRVRVRMHVLPHSQAAGAPGWPWQRHCCTVRIFCCWMSPVREGRFHASPLATLRCVGWKGGGWAG